MKALFFLTTALLAATSAYANNLKGTWSFVGNDNCFLSNPAAPGIIAVAEAPVVLLGGVQGFATFNGNGTGSISETGAWFGMRSQHYIVPDGDVGVAPVTNISQYTMVPFQFTITFMYTVNGDEFTLTESSDAGTFQSIGLMPAGVSSITGAPTVNGTISQNSPPVLQTFTGTPAQEFWAFTDGTNAYAACLRSRTYTKVNN